MTLAFVFPGQGAQTIGMGKALAEEYHEAQLVFDEVDNALGERLSKLIWEGDQEELTLTQNAQPALMATSIAAVRALEAEGFASAALSGAEAAWTAMSKPVQGTLPTVLEDFSKELSRRTASGVRDIQALLRYGLERARDLRATPTLGRASREGHVAGPGDGADPVDHFAVRAFPLEHPVGGSVQFVFDDAAWFLRT